MESATLEFMNLLEDMIAIFEAAESFLEKETGSILLGVSERNLCGSLMLHLRTLLDATAYDERTISDVAVVGLRVGGCGLHCNGDTRRSSGGH
jgi:hypothetical protein